MKTIALPRSPAAFITAFSVVAGLTALYFYRRRGGTLQALYAPISESLSKLRESLARSSAESESHAPVSYAGSGMGTPTP